MAAKRQLVVTAGRSALDQQIAAAVATAANTDHLVQWEALRANAKRLPPAISDQERCALLIRLANGDSVSLSEWCSLVGYPVISGPPTAQIGLTRADHRFVRAELQLRVAGSERAVAERAKALGAVASRCVVRVPRFDRREGDSHLIARHMRSAIAYSLWLLFADSMQFGRDLRICQLNECRRFFLVVRQAAGRPRDTYCSDEHLVEAHRRQVRKRVAEHRARKAGRRTK